MINLNMLDLIILGALRCAFPLSTKADGTIRVSPVARTTAGKMLQMNHDEASAYCAALGARLPTAQEIATALNPDGVSVSPKEGFYLDKPKGEVPFYYNPSTYVRPTLGENDDTNYWSWTSSLPENDFFSGTAIVFVEVAKPELDHLGSWGVPSGSFTYRLKSDARSGVVRCVLSSQ